ncbi:MAG: helical backbone metal receptor [Campylobacterales bacterium]|jgi:iron complex transport system substrate-binding protein|nr:helical backbone metal receptor [Campylobacterales bacterium]
MLLRWFFLLLLSIPLFGYERIIALSPAINEILFALDAGKKVVANTEYCTTPKEAIQKPKVGGYFSPSLEKILALSPDLVVMQDNNLPLTQKLTQLGIKTMVFKIDTIDSIKKAITAIANPLHAQAKAALIIQKIDKSLLAVKGVVKNKKILIVIGSPTDLSKEIYVAGQNLYFDEVIEASGNQNALQSSRKGQPVLNLEKILTMNPDIVIILAPLMKERHITREMVLKPWRNLPINASRTHSIFIEEGEYAGIPSDRVVHFIDDFGGVLREVNGYNIRKNLL